jgi:hypothetical protein
LGIRDARRSGQHFYFSKFAHEMQLTSPTSHDRLKEASPDVGAIDETA